MTARVSSMRPAYEWPVYVETWTAPDRRQGDAQARPDACTASNAAPNRNSQHYPYSTTNTSIFTPSRRGLVAAVPAYSSRFMQPVVAKFDQRNQYTPAS